MSKLILALDLSTKTGWALGRDPQHVEHGVWDLGCDGNHGRYCSCLAARLEDMLAVARPGLVVYEAPLPHVAPRMMSSSVNTVSLQFGLAKVVEMIAYEQSVRCEEASCRDARQKVLGHQPKDGKAGVIAWCINQGWSPADDNAADALLLLRYRQMLASRPSEPKRPNIPGL